MFASGRLGENVEKIPVKGKVSFSLAVAASLMASAQSTPAQEFPVSWFAKPSVNTLRQTPRKAFAHYMELFAVQINPKPASVDYYSLQWLRPEGETGAHAYCGGFLRDRPIPVTADPAATDFRARNLQLEVRRAITMGLDGFDFCLEGSTGSNWTTFTDMLAAANAVDPGFKIMLRTDMNSGEFKAHPENIESVVAAVASNPSLLRTPDGRIILCPYAANNQSPEFYAQIINNLKQRGINIALVPTFQGWQSYASQYAGVSYGMMHWGNVPPNNDSVRSLYPNLAVFCNSVIPQYSRPNVLSFSEAIGSQRFRNEWLRLITQNVDWADIVTWNDYSEGTQVSPSVSTSDAYYQLSAYFTTWFKTRVQPKILRDTMFCFHRAHPLQALYTGYQSGPFKLFGGMPAADVVEVATFLTKPALVRLRVGSAYTYKYVPAGMFAFTAPLQPGLVACELFRNGVCSMSMVSPTEVLPSVEFQDMQYHAVSSTTAVRAP